MTIDTVWRVFSRLRRRLARLLGFEVGGLVGSPIDPESLHYFGPEWIPIPMPPAQQNCGNCWFYREGVCKRFPPTVLPARGESVCDENGWAFPQPYEAQWCGEWRWRQ